MQFLVCTGRSGSVITLLFAILGLSVIVTLLSISDYSALKIVTRFGCVELEAESFFANCLTINYHLINLQGRYCDKSWKNGQATRVILRLVLRKIAQRCEECICRLYPAIY